MAKLLYDSRRPVNPSPDLEGYEVLPGLIQPTKRRVVSAADFGEELDPKKVAFTLFADTKGDVRRELASCTERPNYWFSPALQEELTAYHYQKFFGIGRQEKHQQGRLPVPWGTVVVTAVCPDDGISYPIAVCAITDRFLGFGLRINVTDRPIAPTDLSCDAIFAPPVLLRKTPEMGALHLVYDFLSERVKTLCKEKGRPVVVATVTTRQSYANWLIRERGFKHQLPRPEKPLCRRVPGTVRANRSTLFEHHVLVQTIGLETRRS